MTGCRAQKPHPAMTLLLALCQIADLIEVVERRLA